MFPAKEDLLGKLSYIKAANEKEEELAKSVCYMAYTALKSQNITFGSSGKGKYERALY